MPNAIPTKFAQIEPVVTVAAELEYVRVTGNRVNAAMDVFKRCSATALESRETCSAFDLDTAVGVWQLTLVSLAHEVHTQTVAKSLERKLESTFAKCWPATDIKLEPVPNPNSL
jgi:hypothetical protein